MVRRRESDRRIKAVDSTGRYLDMALMADSIVTRVLKQEKQVKDEIERKATLFVAGRAINALDCKELLEILGLTAEMGKSGTK